MKNFGRIVVCGRISQMNVTTPGSGIKNMAHVLVKRLTIKGFLIFDHENEREPFETDMLKWLSEGKVKFKETIYTGIESAPKSIPSTNKEPTNPKTIPTHCLHPITSL